MRLIGQVLIVALALTCAACKSAGASAGPNPNMEALNAHYGIGPTDPHADYAPLFLYYADAPRPAAPGTSAAPVVASQTSATSHG